MADGQLVKIRFVRFVNNGRFYNDFCKLLQTESGASHTLSIDQWGVVGKEAFSLYQDWRGEKGDLVAVLGLHGKTDCSDVVKSC